MSLNNSGAAVYGIFFISKKYFIEKVTSELTSYFSYCNNNITKIQYLMKNLLTSRIIDYREL